MKRAVLLMLIAVFLPVAVAAGNGPVQIRSMGSACGSSAQDWCAAPAGDPCGAHEDEASCRADARCQGVPYRGESVVACVPDGKGFWSNYPAVGCVSRASKADRP